MLVSRLCASHAWCIMCLYFLSQVLLYQTFALSVYRTLKTEANPFHFLHCYVMMHSADGQGMHNKPQMSSPRPLTNQFHS